MSGIAGWIAPARRGADEAALAPMLGALRQRGIGDLMGYAAREGRHEVVLGASLWDRASRIALVLDGALANARALRLQLAGRGFRFAGETDAEVLLRAYQYWDKDVVKQLRGPLAFALWDARKDRLLLARDRFGEKPLYLHEKGGTLYFASEAKSLLQLPGFQVKVDLSAVGDCLACRYVPGPRTMFAGIRKLPPGSYALAQHGKLHEARYWVPPDRAPYVKAASERALEGFLAALEQAVALHPAPGIFLSGGLDSAVLLALASAAGTAPKAFSLGFEGDKASELPYAAQAARHFGAAHHEIVVAPHELICHLEYLVSCRDAPVPRPSELVLCRLAAEASRSVKRVLTGDGCDEVLGGYRRYVAEIHAGGLEALPARLFAPLVSAGRFDTAAGPLRLNGWHRENFAAGAATPLPAETFDAKTSRLRRALYRDQTGWLPDQLLERNDRAAGAAGLEARMPFLDHRLAEYVSRLPDAMRVRGLTTKWILREFTLEHLQGASSVTRQYYDAAALDRVLAEHLAERKNHETLLWTLLNIEIWHRTYRAP